MSITFKKRTRNVRKSKKIKIGGERVSLDSLVMQISLASGVKNTFVVRAVIIT